MVDQIPVFTSAGRGLQPDSFCAEIHSSPTAQTAGYSRLQTTERLCGNTSIPCSAEHNLQTPFTGLTGSRTIGFRKSNGPQKNPSRRLPTSRRPKFRVPPADVSIYVSGD